jgi:predicted GNAT family N-acyltransferase
MAVHTSVKDPVRLANWPNESELIERFRYRIYVAEQAKQLPGADHSAGRLTDSFDEGAHHFLSERVGHIDGYARLHIHCVPTAVQAQLGMASFLNRPGLAASYLSKVMLAPDRRGGVTFAQLTRHMYRCARLKGTNLFICHAAESLAAQYEGFGWQRFSSAVSMPHMKPQIPLILAPGNRSRLLTARPLLYAVETEFEPVPDFSLS